MDSRNATNHTVMLTGRGAREGCMIDWEMYPGTDCGLLGKKLFQISAVPPGDYVLSLSTTAGLLTAPVTITETGGFVEFTYPPAK